MEGRDLVRAGDARRVPRRTRTSRTRARPTSPAPRHDALPADSRTTATPGAWRSTSTPASAATPASSPARRRTTSRSSARSRSRAAARCTGSASTATSRATVDDPDDLPPAGAVHALRERAVRGRLPGRRHRAQRRRPERHGLQPLRRHALLLEQLPVQGPALQLLPLRRLGHAEPEAAAQPRRHRAQPRRDGEVHLLRAAHQRRRASTAEQRGPPRSATARS